MKIKAFLPQPIVKRDLNAGLPMMKVKIDKYVEGTVFVFDQSRRCSDFQRHSRSWPHK